MLQAWRNVQGRFEDAPRSRRDGGGRSRQPREAFLAGDLDGDNDADLVVTEARAPAVLLRNDGGSANHAILLALTGLADNRSAIGTKVEVLAGAIWQKFEDAGVSGYLGQGSPEILAGLGRVDQADVVRLLWPTGVCRTKYSSPPASPSR